MSRWSKGRKRKRPGRGLAALVPLGAPHLPAWPGSRRPPNQTCGRSPEASGPASLRSSPGQRSIPGKRFTNDGHDRGRALPSPDDAAPPTDGCSAPTNHGRATRDDHRNRQFAAVRRTHRPAQGRRRMRGAVRTTVRNKGRVPRNTDVRRRRRSSPEEVSLP